MTSISTPALNALAPDALVDALSHRYATKRFDPSKRIPAAQWAALEEALVLSPSSYGLQPWKFLVVQDPALRHDLVAASWNQPQADEASHFVVFAVKEELDEAHIDRYLARIAEVRQVGVETLDAFRGMLLAAVKGKTPEQVQAWSSRQVYIALGQFMAAAALLGVDTCPMEGLLPAEYDRILGLEGSGYRTVVACAAGYRSGADKYAGQAKVRFESRDVLKRL